MIKKKRLFKFQFKFLISYSKCYRLRNRGVAGAENEGDHDVMEAENLTKDHGIFIHVKGLLPTP